MEVANARGLCVIANAAQRFCGEPIAAGTEERPGAAGDNQIDDRDNVNVVAPAIAPEGRTSGRVDGPAAPTGEEAGVPAAGGRVADDCRASSISAEQQRKRSAENAAEKAAMLIANGGRAGETAAHPVQQTNSAILEGVAWSLAGRGNADGVGWGWRVRWVNKVLGHLKLWR